MKKTSIFSREFERKVRRKRFIIVSLILIILLIVSLYIVNFSKINVHIKDLYYSTTSKEMSNTNEDALVTYEEEKEELKEDQKAELENENINLKHELTLNNDNKVNILYDKYNEEILFKGVEGDNYSFDLSPSKKRILIEDNITQDTYMLDDSFNLIKLDPEFFYSNSAKRRFYKTDILRDYEGYKWYKDSKFLDENTVVYVSDLPWFGGSSDYIWKTDLTDLNDIKHFMSNIEGQNISFGELTEEGIKVIINNEIKLLTFSFVLND